MSILITSTVRSYPRIPYEKIKDDVLGKKYNLSLVFVGTHRAQQINKKYRQKEYIPNVLSFSIDKTHGEIYLTPQIIRKTHQKYGMKEDIFTGYLFIHALLHLKGYDHSDTMDEAEKKVLFRFFAHTIH